MQIAENPVRYYEVNPILGKHPSKDEVNLYFAAASALWIGGYAVAPEKWKKRMLWGTVGIEGLVVSRNYFGVGIGISF